MRSTTELKKFALAARSVLARDRRFAAWEIYCSSAEQVVARLNYASGIPSRGVEEVKSLGADGFAVRVIARDDPHRIGMGYGVADFDLSALKTAANDAFENSLSDPYFPGLPALSRPPAAGAVESTLAGARDAAVISAGWNIVHQALSAWQTASRRFGDDAGLILGGDVTLHRDRMVLAGSSTSAICNDEGAHFSSAITAFIESLDAKGSAFAIGASRAEFDRAARTLGRLAVGNALATRQGERPLPGKCRVILGPQPVAEILNYMVLYSLSAHAFRAADSAYYGQFGARVMDERLNLYDDPRARGGAIQRNLTCEGAPARRVDLIRAGRLVGLLASHYEAARLSADGEAAIKLSGRSDNGASGAALKAGLPYVNGYRLGEGGGRRFDAAPRAVATNVIMRGRDGVARKKLLAEVGDGILAGRVWYTYPINGSRAGDFTCTISGDSYVVRDGKIAAALAPNCLRINANVHHLFNSILAVGSKIEPAIVWAAPEAFYVPALAVDNLELAEVGASGSD